jgi:hypothetical protein
VAKDRGRIRAYKYFPTVLKEFRTKTIVPILLVLRSFSLVTRSSWQTLKGLVKFYLGQGGKGKMDIMKISNGQARRGRQPETDDGVTRGDHMSQKANLNRFIILWLPQPRVNYGPGYNNL